MIRPLRSDELDPVVSRFDGTEDEARQTCTLLDVAEEDVPDLSQADLVLQRDSRDGLWCVEKVPLRVERDKECGRRIDGMGRQDADRVSRTGGRLRRHLGSVQKLEGGCKGSNTQGGAGQGSLKERSRFVKPAQLPGRRSERLSERVGRNRDYLQAGL